MKRTGKAAALVLLAVGCGGHKQEPMQRTGKGSTFVYPLMVQWAAAYAKTEGGCRIDYQPFGSGAGIKGLLEQEVDFACTDAPLTDEQSARARAAGGEVVHIPLVLGALVAAYNLPEVEEPLRFSGPVLADISLGKVTKWDERALQDLNPGVADRLPDRNILVVRRRDGSGIT
jgi:phosphate transport system substrate-binding protein